METQKRQSGIGVASLILGIIGMILSCIAIGIVPCAIGLIFAIIGITQKDKAHGTSIAGLVCSTIGISIFLLGIFFFEGSDDSSKNISENTGTVEIYNNSSDSNQPNTSKLEVDILAEYTLPDGIGWYTRHFIVIQNNTNETVDVSTSSLAYTKDGTMVGADDADFMALGSGCTSVLYEAFEVDSKIDYYETELNVTKSKYYESVIQDLSFVKNDIENGAVFQVTNEGEDSAKFVEGYALFFLGDELVGYESTYFTDDDSEIKPGKTISKQMTAYKDFDRIEFYLTGRK